MVDTTPIGVVSDAFPLLRKVDGAIAVGRVGLCTRDTAAHLREQPARLEAPVLGIVANAVKLGAAEGRAASLVPVGTFDQPIFVTSDPDNPDRLFVVERDGMVQLVEGGRISAFADLTALVSCCDSERGLLPNALEAGHEARANPLTSSSDERGLCRGI